jgi:DNA polymerase I-like protein with 3'-5' exonuclease and polymerase domains
LEKCEGNALINYNSDKQVLAAMYEMRKGFNERSLPGISIDTLEKHKDKPVAQALLDYSDLKKKIGTYGAQWVTQWTTKPCKDEGWLHPGDGRLHSRINQLEAETGRTSSTAPNTQNLEAIEEVRSCFIADPPDESIRVSVCCDGDTFSGTGQHVCVTCGQACETKAEEYAIITADMSGAELRLIAELAQADSWITALNKDQDVHAVGTEIMYPHEWPTLTEPGCAYFERHTEDKDILVKGVLYHIKAGDPKKQKCDCKGHKKKRNGNKAANFKLAYGGKSLADDLGCTEEESQEIMHLHEQANPDVWAYLKHSGNSARATLEARSMFGRRRLFPQPTWEGAADFWRSENATEDNPNPTTKQVSSAFKGMFASIERRGKNHPVQASNVDIAKRAIGAGFDKDGKPYLWHQLLALKAKMLSFVHDELIVQAPKRYAQKVAELIADAFARAGAEVMTRIEMKSDYHIGPYWQK